MKKHDLAFIFRNTAYKWEGKKIIRVRHPDCDNTSTMQQNYSGLWRTLGLQAMVTKKGFVVYDNTHIYRLEN